MSGHSALRSALQICLERGLTFAAFRTPGEPVELWAQFTPDVEVVEGDLMWELNEVFVIAPFLLDPARVPFIRSDVELLFGEFGPDVQRLHACLGTQRKSYNGPPTTPQGEFESNVSAVRDACRNGALDKAVISRVVREQVKREEMIGLFIAAANEYPRSCVVLAHTPEHGLWLGASPERLVWEEEDHVRVDALAGTRGHGAQPWTPKEQHEQQVVADSVLETLNALGLENITMAKTTTVQSGALDHLHTSFEADLGTRPLSDVVLALHPTPAVCGAPRDKARAFIQQRESHPRDLYSGFWGPWNPDGRTELFVNIRCMRAVDDGAVLYMGAGITAESQAQLEWEETERKADTWRILINALK